MRIDVCKDVRWLKLGDVVDLYSSRLRLINFLLTRNSESHNSKASRNDSLLAIVTDLTTLFQKLKMS